MIGESDLAELGAAVLTGVTIGVGSHILIFGNGVTLLIQCLFKTNSESGERWGTARKLLLPPCFSII
jgi:hypothetical protein